MTRKRAHIENILEVLRERTMTFSEIKKGYKEKFEKEINSPTLAENLTYAIRQEFVRRNEETIKGRLRGRITYSLLEPYYNKNLKDEIIKMIESEDKVNLIVPSATLLGSDDEFPRFMKEIPFPPPYGYLEPLRDATIQRFGFELKRKLINIFGEREKIVMELLARLVWSGFLMEASEEKKLVEKLQKHRPFRHHPKNLDELREKKENKFSIYLSSVMEKVFPKLVHELPNYLWGLLECSIPRIIDRGEKIAGTLNENLTFIKKHETLLKNILKAIRSIKYMIIIHVGYPFNYGQFLTILRFRKWFTLLNEGKLDHRHWIFEDGPQIVRRAHIYVKKGMVPPRVKLDLETWDLRDLYNHHPMGKNPKFYKEINDAIYKRIDRRRSDN